MKKSVFISFVFAVITLISVAQDCDSYFPSQVGTVFDVTQYDDKDKVQSVTTTTVTSAENVTDGFQVTLSAVYYDTKEKETGKQVYTTLCKDGVFYIDMKSFMPSDGSTQDTEMQMQIEASNMEIPSTLVVGQTLPDAWIKMSFSAEGMPAIMSQTVYTTNRKVEGFEDVTTPAGTYSCVKISFDTEMKMMMSIKTHSVVWYSKGVGTVRTENYDKKGKLQGYSLLTRFVQ